MNASCSASSTSCSSQLASSIRKPSVPGTATRVRARSCSAAAPRNRPTDSPPGRTAASAARSSAEMRLAVIVATQPFSNRTRALAISSNWLETAAPSASTLAIGLLTRLSTRSRSWIIRSRITETSVPRGLNGAMRVASIYSGRADAGGNGRVFRRVAQQVAHLQHAAPGLRQLGQPVRLLQRGGDRLFHQHVAALRQSQRAMSNAPRPGLPR